MEDHRCQQETLIVPKSEREVQLFARQISLSPSLPNSWALPNWPRL
jgi:hypothetical protein